MWCWTRTAIQSHSMQWQNLQNWHSLNPTNTDHPGNSASTNTTGGDDLVDTKWRHERSISIKPF